MHLQMLASGSAGNAVLVRAGELNLLVDAGPPIDVLEKRLADARLPLARPDAILLTHGHLDHARSAGLLSRKSGARVYCSEGVMSKARLASATVVLPWMISSTSADLRRAVQRLISSSITALMVSPSSKVTPEQEFTGSLHA